LQQGRVFKLTSTSAYGTPLWAYRYRTGGRGAKRVQRGGFVSEEDARAALGRALEKLRREGGIGRTVTLAEFVDEYLAQHDASPVTLKKLRFLLTRAVQAFGDYCLDELDAVEIASWRMTGPPGYRFEATQALRQVLARAVVWGLVDVNPAKQGVDNPQRRRTEKHPFESSRGTSSRRLASDSVLALLVVEHGRRALRREVRRAVGADGGGESESLLQDDALHVVAQPHGKDFPTEPAMSLSASAQHRRRSASR
jgi:hypothetical protein